MMDDGFTHIKESSEDTQRHLEENRDKFETDALYLLRLMKMGKRLSSDDVHVLKINDRRLRELFAEGKCEKSWKINEAGKRLYVEYYCEIPKPMTKGKLIELYNQQKLF